MADNSLPDLASLGTLALNRRREESLSQKGLAHLAGCSHISIIALEKGTGRVNLSTAWRILGALGLVETEGGSSERLGS